MTTETRDSLAMEWDLQPDTAAGECPFRAASKLLEGPPIQFKRGEHHVRAEGLGGNWVITRQALQAEVLRDPELFSSHLAIGFSRLIGESWPLVPLELDPPEHTQFRTLLMPWFSAPRAREMTSEIRSLAISLIEEIKPRGSVEFMEHFGSVFPVTVFMQMMGLPREQMPRFLQWENDMLRGETMGIRGDAALAIKTYLVDLVEERREKPGNDIVSYILDCDIEGAPLSEARILGTVFMLFAGGLDTVASSLGFIFRTLASDQALQERLRSEPTLIDAAVEEFLRAYGVVTTFRYVTRDCEFHGVAMRKGDLVEIPFGLGSRDDAVYECPHDIKPDRANKRNITFSTGPHTCLGRHLARAEIKVAIEEWLARVPPFSISDSGSVKTAAESVWAIECLPLCWDSAN